MRIGSIIIFHLSKLGKVKYEKSSSSYCVMWGFWWGCRGNLKLITLLSERVKVPGSISSYGGENDMTIMGIFRRKTTLPLPCRTWCREERRRWTLDKVPPRDMAYIRVTTLSRRSPRVVSDHTHRQVSKEQHVYWPSLLPPDIFACWHVKLLHPS